VSEQGDREEQAVIETVIDMASQVLVGGGEDAGHLGVGSDDQGRRRTTRPTGP
jgi:hypothetical protein